MAEHRTVRQAAADSVVRSRHERVEEPAERLLLLAAEQVAAVFVAAALVRSKQSCRTAPDLRRVVAEAAEGLQVERVLSLLQEFESALAVMIAARSSRAAGAWLVEQDRR